MYSVADTKAILDDPNSADPEARADFVAALRTLSLDERKLITLQGLGFTTREMGTRMGTSHMTASRALKQAIRRLTERMNGR